MIAAMPNSARELFEMLSTWRTAHGDNAAYVANGRGKDYLTATREAARHLDKIDLAVDAWEASGKPVAIHRKHLHRWACMVYAVPHGWTSNVSGDSAYPEDSLDALSMFADLLDMIEAVSATPIVLDHVREYVLVVRNALAEDDSLEDDFRAYMEHLIGAIENAIEHRDALLLQEELQHLWIAVFAAEAQSSQPGKWKAPFARFTRDFMIQLLSSVASTAITGQLPSSVQSAPAVES